VQVSMHGSSLRKFGQKREFFGGEKYALQEVGSARTGVEKSSGGRRRFGLRWIEKSPRGPGVVVLQPVANTLLPVRRAHSPQWPNVALPVSFINI